VGLVDDQEVVAAHLVPPLRLQVGGHDDQDAPSAVAKDQLMRDPAGLDRLPQADIVGDQEADARHPDRTHERVELVDINLDSALEGGEQLLRVGGRGGAPAHRVEDVPGLSKKVLTATLRKLEHSGIVELLEDTLHRVDLALREAV
jgi:hypothetical protein